MKALSVTESKVSDPSSDSCTEHDARELKEDVGVEWNGVQASLIAEVPASEGSTCSSEGEPTTAAEDLEACVQVRGSNVEQVRVVLNEIDRSGSFGEILIRLGGGVRVCLLVTMVVVAIVTHIYYTLIYIIT